MNLNQLAALLGGTVNGEWLNIPGPGHHADDRSLGIMFDKSGCNGFRVHSFAGDDPRTCRTHVKRLLRERRRAENDDGPPVEPLSVEGAGRASLALRIWEHATAPEGTLVERYLRLRGCALTPGLKTGEVIRFHARCRFGAERVPAMVALMRDILTDEPTGVHRTALNDQGTGKREVPGGAKRMLGVAASAVVKLQPHDGVLGIAEGVETGISAAQLFAVPTWALLSAGTIKTCPIIPGVERLLIFADHDDAGLAAAGQCARRYSNNGISAAVQYPHAPNSDWNDSLKEKM